MSQRFDEAATDWDKGDIRQQIAHNVFHTIVSRITLLKTMDILDFGAGTGLLSFKIAPLVRSVTGVDLSTGMLEQLEAKNSDILQVRGICHDMLSEPLKDKFDGIVSSMAMHHVKETAKLLESFYAHLKPNGFIALADLDAEDGTFHTHGNEGVEHFGFDREPLRALLEQIGFKNVRFHTALTVNNENGAYPIFLVTGMK